MRLHIRAQYQLKLQLETVQTKLEEAHQQIVRSKKLKDRVHTLTQLQQHQRALKAAAKTGSRDQSKPLKKASKLPQGASAERQRVECTRQTSLSKLQAKRGSEKGLSPPKVPSRSRRYRSVSQWSLLQKVRPSAYKE